MHPTTLPIAIAVAFAIFGAPSAEAQRRSSAAAVTTACVDFYAHVNRAWMQAHPASASQPERSRLAQLAADSAARHTALLSAAMAAPQNSDEAALGRFWAAGIDEPALESRSAAALQAALAPLALLRRPRDVGRTNLAFHSMGLMPLFEFLRLEATDGRSTALAVLPAPLGLVDPAFYTGTDAELRSLLGHYHRYIEAILRASGLPEAEVRPASEAVLQMETQLAQALAAETADAPSSDRLRAQDRRYAALGLADLLEHLEAEPDDLVVANPAYFAALTRIVSERNVQRLAWYLRFRIVHRLAPDLGSAFREPHAAFFAQTLRGLPTGPSRVEHMQILARRDLAGLVDAAFIARYASLAQRQRAEAIIDAVRDAAVEMVANTDQGAADVLRRARLDIAGSLGSDFDANKLDTSALELRSDDHIGNLLRLSRWQESRVLAGQATLTGSLPAHDPVLLWLPATETLTVSAAALAPPLLSATGSASEAAGFGALGALAGHELSKAIAPGSRGASLGPLFNGFQAAPNLRVDGNRTLPMNRADQAGLEFAWLAFQKTEPQADANASKAFFTAWAALWAKTQTTEALRAEVQTSPFAPATFRVNGPLSQMPAFAETFGCRAGQPMRSASPIAVWR